MPKILVVDDDLVVLATTSIGLKQAGYEVLQADNGGWALKICQELKPDLVLLDVRMPVMSGIEVASVLSKWAVPVIFLSAYSDEDMVKSAAQVGALGYLVKPVEISRIVPAIEVALMRADEQIKAGQVIENLTTTLEKNREIDISIGLLMERRRLDRVKAFERLRNYARSNRMKLIEVAKALIAGTIDIVL